jgi:hypothetical protein
MKQLPRRMFLKALAAAPAIAQRAAEEAVGAATAVGVDDVSMMGQTPVSPFVSGPAPKMIELATLAKAGLLPSWAKRQALRNMHYDRRLDPDIACLQSISLSAKIHISMERRMARAWDTFERDALDQKLMAEFMGWSG